MNKFKLSAAIAAIVLVIVALVSWPRHPSIFGSQVQNDTFAFTGGIQLNQNGLSTATQLNNLVFSSSCTLTTPATSATSSDGVVFAASCAATGAKSGDTVLAQFSSTTLRYYRIVGVSASSTANYITVGIAHVGGDSTTTIPSLKVNVLDLR